MYKRVAGEIDYVAEMYDRGLHVQTYYWLGFRDVLDLIV